MLRSMLGVFRSGALTASLTFLAWGLTGAIASAQAPGSGSSVDRVVINDWVRTCEAGHLHMLRQDGTNPSGWGDAGRTFIALKSGGAGRVGIREWTASHDRRAYTKEGENLGAGWTKGDIVFYAYDQPAPDTVPIYSHNAKLVLGGVDHGNRMYMTPKVVGGPGWTKERTAFYAYPLPQQAVVLQQWVLSNESGHMRRLLPEGTSPDGQWRTEGRAFIAMSQPTPDTVPILEWTASDNRYTYRPETDAPGGMTRGGIQFYAFAKPIPGTMPVNEYEAPCSIGGVVKGNKNALTIGKYEAGSGWNYRGVAFHAFPADPEILRLKISSTTLEFDAGAPSAKLTSDVVIDQEIVRMGGASDSEVSQKVSFSKKKDETFSWGFEESLTVGMKTEVEAGIPLLGAGKLELSAELELGAKQEWETTESYEYAYEGEIKIAPNERVTVKGVINWGTIPERRFTMESIVEGTVQGKKIPNTYLKPIFQSLNPVVTKLYNIPGNNEAIKMQIRGTVSGKAGISTSTTVTSTDPTGKKMEKAAPPSTKPSGRIKKKTKK